MTAEFPGIKIKQEPIGEEVKIEDLILPTKQVQKVDEKLTVEFSEIKQEPIIHSETYLKYDQAKYNENSNCISCNAVFAPCREIATIHESCYEKMLKKLNMATEKIQEMEIKNRELQSKSNNLQSTIENIGNEHKTVLSINAQRMSVIVKKYERENEELHEKLSLARKEVQEFAEEREKMIYENEKGIDFHSKTKLKVIKFKEKTLPDTKTKQELRSMGQSEERSDILDQPLLDMDTFDELNHATIQNDTEISKTVFIQLETHLLNLMI